MNVSRSTIVQRGCVLTALTVAVLLAGFSVTAWAQTTSPISIGLAMRASSSTLPEGADTTASTQTPVTVTITRSGADTYDPTPGDATNTDDNQTPIFASGGTHLTLRATCNGEPTAAGDDCSFSVRVKGATSDLAVADLGGNGATLNFADGPDTDTLVDKTIELVISDTADDGDWNEEEIALTLDLQQQYPGSETSGRELSAPTRTLTLTITDDERLPTLKFTPPGIQLAKGNTQIMTVGVGVGAGGRGSLPDGIRGTLDDFDGGSARGGSSDELLLSVSPPEAVGRLIAIWKDESGDGTMQPSERIEPDGQNRYSIGTIGAGTATGDQAVNGAVGAATTGNDDGIALRITAIDVSGFRDEQIMFTVEDGRTEAQQAGDGGAIEDANPATVTVLSGEETPTVTFSKASVSIDEGDSETVHLLADTNQGDQVGSATVSVSGDARISLQQNGSAISGGTVSFDGSANAELTIRALGDESLEDGEEKTATVTITDASGANIGDPRAVTVTVVGSTAVPVLPLVGQLLLALLLTAGGARFYRRRQQ